ncbi:AAA family ATPase [Ottowia sp. GY511]|uniref:AAA family ATPase n=1 Tax=Ottowia flava TaxID=2675430 RepID=A0ABW4KXN0_9BURK|nr:AAA family ATPase [Ottowia sp. GY511]TXK31500.1 AAA family ATPase [Ottowia sp. GY511]
MTLFKPTLIVNHLTVIKDARVVLEIQFHKGLNIIRGHNSSGKTTALDFIAYTMGAEDIPWKKESLLCDYSVLDVSLNGENVTLRRDISEKRQQPLYIYWGQMAEALTAPIVEWEQYPFRRSSNKLSFTQILLQALGLPEAQGDGASNLTMHQFLRVIYADQPSLHSPIFRIDSFDSALTRETVGNYLSGTYNEELYSAQLSRRNFEKDLSQAESELKSIFHVLAKSDQYVDLEHFGQQILDAQRRRATLLEEVRLLKAERTIKSDQRRSEDDGATRASLDSAKKELASTMDTIVRIELEIADSRKFIEEVTSRLKSLDESQDARSYFGSIVFNFCPCCLAELKVGNGEVCVLCKNPMDGNAGEVQILRMRNELLLQLKESEGIIQIRENEVRALRLNAPELKQTLRILEQRYIELNQFWSSELELSLENASREIGSLDREITSLYENQRLASVIKDLQARRDDLQQTIHALDSSIEVLLVSQEDRKSQVFYAVASALSRLLKKDLYRQQEFRTAEQVHFSFIDNQIIIDGSAKFSESSTAVLRHLFHLALLTASTEIPTMRFPRFLILDGIEDGGMERPRAYRLQEIIAEECSTYEVDFQVIIATSQIAPSLNVEEFVVGRAFTEDQRALAIL